MLEGVLAEAFNAPFLLNNYFIFYFLYYNKFIKAEYIVNNMKGVDDREILDRFTEDFCSIVNKYAKYIIVSGFVAISHGRSRATEDVDIMIEEVSQEKFKKIHNELIKYGFECKYPREVENIYDMLKNDRANVRYTWIGKELPNMEVKFTRDSLDIKQLETRTKLKMTGLDVFFAKIEESIAFKEEYLGSEKDLEDAKHLRLIYDGELDLDYIKSYKEKINNIKIKWIN